jgi:hypothetical protein
VNLELASESGTGDRRRTRRHQQLIRWQVAIAACFFLMVSLSARVLLTAMRHDPGMKLEGLAVALVDGTRQWDAGRIRRATTEMLAFAERAPGVEAAAVSIGLPFGVGVLRAPISTPDRPFAEGPSVFATNPREAYFIAATPGIFRTLGIPIVAGRTFDARDDASAGAAAVLNETSARTLFGTRDAVGRRILFRNQNRVVTATVIGIAGDTDTMGFNSHRGSVLWVPLHQQDVPGQLIFSARGTNTADAARVLQAAMRDADAEMSTRAYGEAWVILTFPYYQFRVAALGVGALGLLTLLLGMTGLYGVQSQTVTHRTREVGVRVALGATAQQIQRMILKAGFIPVAQGIVLGLTIGSLTRLALRVTLELPIAIVDPLALVVVPIPVVLAAVLACIIPAYRAARVDPKVALRHL